MNATCLCGAVTVEIDSKPEFIHDCNCSLCRKTGGVWGYFSPASVLVTGVTQGVSRSDVPTPCVEVHHCVSCAVTTHWTLTEGYRAANPSADQVGVNMRLFDPDDLAGVEVRYPDGKAWSGEGSFEFRRAPATIDSQHRW